MSAKDASKAVPNKASAAAKVRSARKAITKVLPFNPLEKRVLGAAIAEVLLTTRVYALTERFPCKGPGIYAIYYTGNFSAYGKLAELNKAEAGKWPIYVGQALPTGGRRGIEVDAEGNDLRERVSKHLRSLKSAENLNPDDFQYRALVMDDAFIRLGETSLLALYKPIWNKYVDGFGNNTPGKGRANSMRSRWDTLHGGRSQALEHLDRLEDVALILKEIERELANTNFDLPETLVNAREQSMGFMPDMSLERVVNEDEQGSDDSERT